MPDSRRTLRFRIAVVLATALAVIVDGALTPRSARAQTGDIVETAVAAGSFGTLATALEAAGLVETLRGEGPFTVFAPTDDAFAELPEGTVASLLEPENRDQLVAILTYHVVPGRVPAEQVVELDRATTVNGAQLRIRASGDGVRVDDADVVTTDIFATNGVIHVIDEVLLPPSVDAEARRMSRRGDADLRRVRDLLDLAIERGVPLFNQGDADATAAVYEVAAEAALAGSFGLPSTARRALVRGLREGRRTHDDRARAWVYRGALDRALDELDGRMRTRSRDRH
jgi:uncharacterized surface protein with fasciclin (FAS1) repeats